MCQGFRHFSVVLHHFAMAKLATGSIRVECGVISVGFDRIALKSSEGDIY